MVIHEDQAERTAYLGQFIKRGLLHRQVWMCCHERRKNVGVTVGVLICFWEQFTRVFADVFEALGKFMSVSQVAIMGECEVTSCGSAECWLRVIPATSTGCAVTRVTDCNVSVQSVESRLSKDLRHQTHVFVNHDVGPIAHSDASRFLAAMLQCVKTKEG